MQQRPDGPRSQVDGADKWQLCHGRPPAAFALAAESGEGPAGAHDRPIQWEHSVPARHLCLLCHGSTRVKQRTVPQPCPNRAATKPNPSITSLQEPLSGSSGDHTPRLAQQHPDQQQQREQQPWHNARPRPLGPPPPPATSLPLR